MGRILVVEDDADLADVLVFNLRARGHDVTHAGDGASALQRWDEAEATAPFELVLLDLMLPDLPGFEVLRLIRSRTSRQPGALIVSAVVGEHAREQALAFGRAGFLRKPFLVSELVAEVARLLALPP